MPEAPTQHRGEGHPAAGGWICRSWCCHSNANPDRIESICDRVSYGADENDSLDVFSRVRGRRTGVRHVPCPRMGMGRRPVNALSTTRLPSNESVSRPLSIDKLPPQSIIRSEISCQTPAWSRWHANNHCQTTDNTTLLFWQAQRWLPIMIIDFIHVMSELMILTVIVPGRPVDRPGGVGAPHFIRPIRRLTVCKGAIVGTLGTDATVR